MTGLKYMHLFCMKNLGDQMSCRFYTIIGIMLNFCFYMWRPVVYMSHQSMSEPSFPQLPKIMSEGTWWLRRGNAASGL